MKPVIIIAIAFVLLVPTTVFAQSEREWITSGPFQIDKSEYAIGEKIFIRINDLSQNDKGEIAVMRPLNSTHYTVYLTIPFDGADKSSSNFYLDPKISSERGIFSTDDLVGEWAVAFRGTNYSNLNFKISEDVISGYEENSSDQSTNNLSTEEETVESENIVDNKYSNYLFNPETIAPTVFPRLLYTLDSSDILVFDVLWKNEGKDAVNLNGFDMVYLKDNEGRTYDLHFTTLKDGTECMLLDVTINPGLEKRVTHCFEIPKTHPEYFDLVINSYSKSTLIENTKGQAEMHWTDRENFWGNVQTITLEEEKSQTKSSSGGGCLIATATYGSELAPQVQQLRELRDNQLLSTASGTNFMNTFNDIYYSFSPVIADYERENPVFREMVKVAITPMITSLSLMEYAESESEVLGIGISLIVLNLGMYFGIPLVTVIGMKKRF